MVKYIVIVDIRVDKFKEALSNKSISTSTLKGWDFESPLFCSGTGCRLTITPRLENATMFNNERAAEHYSRKFLANRWYYVASIRFIKTIRVAKLIGAGKCYSLRITPKFEMATLYNKESDAKSYSYDFFECYSGNFRSYITSVDVIKVMLKPHIINVCSTSKNIYT